MKVIADKFPNAGKLLKELLEFQDLVAMMIDEAAPYSQAGNGRALPRFIAETTTKLNSLLVPDFGRRFPAIHDFVVNGETAGEESQTQRLPNACFLFDSIQKELKETKCVIMADEKRSELTRKLERVCADIVVFMCLQFKLYNMSETDEVMMAVSSQCEEFSCAPDVFYGEMLMALDGLNQSWFAWEPMSPRYEDLQMFDPVFAAECEENNYPLTDDMAAKLVEGEADIAVVRGQLAEFIKSRTETEVDITPSTLFSRMKLE